jgi:radical SAM superfamily enzyme YgiQ (UPF0313 family)
VAAVVEQLGYPVTHLDLNGISNYEEAVANLCQSMIQETPTPTPIFGLTATTPQMVAATRITRVIRFTSPSARIVLGGPHPTLVHAAAQQGSLRALPLLKELTTKFNVIVAGDGEESIACALEANPPSLIDADDPKTSLFLTSQRIAELPFPQRSLIDLDSYHYEIDGVRATPLIAQLGCPFGCNFCAGRDSAMLRRVRMRPTSNIIAEMQHIYLTYGIRGFMWFDDETNVNKGFMGLMNAICDLQSDLGVEFRCRGFVKSELFTEAQAAAMHRAGFRKILCGFESGNDRILKNINKQATKDENTRAMEISHKYGLGMKALMSIGHPGESPETLQDTLEWVISVAPNDVDYTIITPYPGSPYFDKSRHLGGKTWAFEVNGDRLYQEEIDYSVTEDFYKGSMDSYKSYVWTDFLSEDELVAHRDSMERKTRDTLKLPYYQPRPGISFEHSMGQSPILRRSGDGR